MIPDEFLIIFVIAVALIVTVLTIRNILHAERTKKRVEAMNAKLDALHPTTVQQELGLAGKPKL